MSMSNTPSSLSTDRMPGPSGDGVAIRVAYVQYLNTLPLVEGLGALRGVECMTAVPSRLAGMLIAGEVDVALASVIDAAKNPGLVLVPAGMIGCDGPTLTVRLFSKVPWERVTVLHADTDSHTSVVLAQVILAKRFGVRPAVVDFDAPHHDVGPVGALTAVGPAAAGPTMVGAQAWPETALMIGDKIVTDPPPAGVYEYELDLGEEWKALTGLPFVYAMWMCRGADVAAGAAKRAAIIALGAMLDRQRRRNTMRTEWLIERYSQQHGWPAELARRYVTEYLRYAVGEREREAVGVFIGYARELGLVGGTAPGWVEG